jgi:ribosomal protein L37E
MEPTRSPKATVTDLLDRILDKGILLNTDIIISVSGIPLLGVNLKLALAGIETMLQYGIMNDWDEAQRVIATKEVQDSTPPLYTDEHIIYSTFATHWYSKGIYECWRPGTLYVTNKRLFIFRKMPAEILFQTYYEEIKAIDIKEKPHYTGIDRKEINLLLREDEVMPIHVNDAEKLKEVIENVLKTKNIMLKNNVVVPDKKEISNNFLQEENLINEDKLWYLTSVVSNGKVDNQWRSGHLYLTDKRLCWWCDFDKKILFDIPSNKIINAIIEGENFGNTLVGEKSIIILYRNEDENKVACFSGNENILEKWKNIIEEQVKGYGTPSNIETCPRCGKEADRNKLLKEGCSRCGWVSHRIDRIRAE